MADPVRVPRDETLRGIRRVTVVNTTIPLLVAVLNRSSFTVTTSVLAATVAALCVLAGWAAHARVRTLPAAADRLTVRRRHLPVAVGVGVTQVLLFAVVGWVLVSPVAGGLAHHGT